MGSYRTFPPVRPIAIFGVGDTVLPGGLKKEIEPGFALRPGLWSRFLTLLWDVDGPLVWT